MGRSGRYLAGALLFGAFSAPAIAGPTAGHDKQFFLSDEDGGTRLNVTMQLQTRYLLTLRRDDPPSIGADNETTTGFDVRRAKIRLDGTLGSKRLKYRLNGAFMSLTGAMFLEDAWVSYDLGGAWTVQAGQFKPPLLREELVSSSAQLTVERSVANEAFNQGYAQGVMLSWTSDRVRVSGSFTDGLATLNTPYNGLREADAAVTARVETILGEGGDWGRFRDFTSWRGAEFNAMLGLAAHYETSGDTNPSAAGLGVDREFLTLTADASLEGDGWNAFASFIWRRTDTAGMPTFDDLGASAQGGVFVTDRAELFARWDAVFADPDRAAAGDELHTLAAGFNYYFLPESHAAKLTANVLWYLDPVGPLAGVVTQSSGVPVLSDANADQVAFVVQMQLLF